MIVLLIFGFFFQGRRPLSVVQNIGSAKENEMVGRQQPISKLGAKPPTDSQNIKNAFSKVKSGAVVKKKVTKVLVSKEVQTENGDISLVTGGTHGLASI